MNIIFSIAVLSFLTGCFACDNQNTTIVTSTNTQFTAIQSGITKGNRCQPGGLAAVTTANVVVGQSPFENFEFYAKGYNRLTTLTDFATLFGVGPTNWYCLISKSSMDYIETTSRLPDFYDSDVEYRTLLSTNSDVLEQGKFVDESIASLCTSISFQASNKSMFFLACNNHTAYSYSLAFWMSGNNATQEFIDYQKPLFATIDNTTRTNDSHFLVCAYILVVVLVFV